MGLWQPSCVILVWIPPHSSRWSSKGANLLWSLVTSSSFTVPLSSFLISPDIQNGCLHMHNHMWTHTYIHTWSSLLLCGNTQLQLGILSGYLYCLVYSCIWFKRYYHLNQRFLNLLSLPPLFQKKSITQQPSRNLPSLSEQAKSVTQLQQRLLLLTCNVPVRLPSCPIVREVITHLGNGENESPRIEP